MTLNPSVSIALDETLAHRYLANVSLSYDNRWIALTMDKSGVDSSGQRVPLIPPFRFRVYIYENSRWTQAIPELSTEKLYYYAQPMPGDQWLLASARPHSREDLNGDVLDSRGRIVRSIFFDDGIEDVQTTGEGDIWVSYFDEGIFGGFQYSQSGLACFTGNGTPRMEFTPDISDRFGISDISDCYALNVCENGETWTSYYTDFPIVKLKGVNFEKAWPDFPARPIRAIAVSRGRLLLFSDYQKSGALFLGDLEKRTIEEVEVVDSTGKQLKFDRAIGRNATLGFVCDWNSKRSLLHQFNFE